MHVFRSDPYLMMTMWTTATMMMMMILNASFRSDYEMFEHGCIFRYYKTWRPPDPDFQFRSLDFVLRYASSYIVK